MGQQWAALGRKCVFLRTILRVVFREGFARFCVRSVVFWTLGVRRNAQKRGSCVATGLSVPRNAQNEAPGSLIDVLGSQFDVPASRYEAAAAGTTSWTSRAAR